MLNWIQQFDTFCFLDNHQYQIEPHSEECLIAAGVKRSCSSGSLIDLQAFIDEKKDAWLFGHLGYDVKNEIHDLRSTHEDHVCFPELFFFEPEILIRLSADSMHIEATEPAKVYAGIMRADAGRNENNRRVEVVPRIDEKEYITIIQQLRQHILRGDCYEINFCQEFFSKSAAIHPVNVYERLSQISPNPFSALYRLKDRWLMCASPERFLKKEGTHILSQPIKGTSKREPENASLDAEQKLALANSSKDRSENVMVVDLVRNDLARVCQEGTVKVDELYGVYSFPQVHQMISTVSGTVKAELNFTDIIKATFPMGSMTGAPKKRVMELIEQYEKTKRGLFSGALGYIAPGGDFDLNVVIRSIFFNAATNYLSYQVGSGITFYSEPAKEWEECLMKASAMRAVLEM